MFWFILESRPCIYLFQFSFKTLHKFLKEKSFQTITWTDLTEFYRTPWKKQQKKSKLQIVVQGSLWCRSLEQIFADRFAVVFELQLVHSSIPEPKYEEGKYDNSHFFFSFARIVIFYVKMCARCRLPICRFGANQGKIIAANTPYKKD